MKLSECDKAVFAYLQLSASVSAEEIRTSLPFTAHQIRHSLGKLRESGALSQRAMVDIFLLGYRRVNLFFALNETGLRCERDFLAF